MNDNHRQDRGRLPRRHRGRPRARAERHRGGSRLARTFALLSITALAAGGALVALAGTASADTIVKINGGIGNATNECQTALGDSTVTGVKLDTGNSGTYIYGTNGSWSPAGLGVSLSVTITNNGKTFSFGATPDVSYVLLKSSTYWQIISNPVGNTDYTSQIKNENGKIQQISHLTFCYGSSTPPPPRETGTLTLVKSVVDETGAVISNADLSLWNLTATNKKDSTDSFTGTSGISGTVKAGATYKLSESGPQVGYRNGTDWDCATDEQPQATYYQSKDRSNDTVKVSAGESVTCTITNTKLTDTTVTVTKEWIIDGQQYVVGTNNPPAGFSANLTIQFYGDESATSVISGQPNSAGKHRTVWVNETGVTYPDGCSVPDRPVATYKSVEIPGQRHELTPGGDNPITITNTVNCTTLTLQKAFEGSGDASQWTLTAAKPATGGSAAQQISGKTGDGAVTNAYVPAGAYALSESGPANYQQTGLACTAEDGDASDSVPVTDGTVDVAPGAHVTCTFTNKYAPPTTDGGGNTPNITPSPTSVTPDFTAQCLLVNGTRQVTITPVQKPGLTYDLTGNGTSSVTVTASAPSPNFVVSVPTGWTPGAGDSASIVVTADSQICVGDVSEVTPGTPKPQVKPQVKPQTPQIEVQGVSQEVPPAPSANAHTGQGQSPWAYVLLGLGALLLLGAVRARRSGRA